jgi:hypothetical protein
MPKRTILAVVGADIGQKGLKQDTGAAVGQGYRINPSAAGAAFAVFFGSCGTARTGQIVLGITGQNPEFFQCIRLCNHRRHNHIPDKRYFPRQTSISYSASLYKKQPAFSLPLKSIILSSYWRELAKTELMNPTRMPSKCSSAVFVLQQQKISPLAAVGNPPLAESTIIGNPQKNRRQPQSNQ